MQTYWPLDLFMWIGTDCCAGSWVRCEIFAGFGLKATVMTDGGHYAFVCGEGVQSSNTTGQVEASGVHRQIVVLKRGRKEARFWTALFLKFFYIKLASHDTILIL
jgi:hypothetical protein